MVSSSLHQSICRGQSNQAPRYIVEADPATLRRHPELDPLLEADDRIHVPKRPSTVTVTGEVLAAATLQFVEGKAPEAYLHEAGGVTRYADEDRSFLILPNGTARPLALSSWNHTIAAVPPGTTLVVPRDPKPFELLGIAKEVGPLLGNLALIAASIAVVGR
ncbi:capsule biosynthesis GfcC family protein [Azospirillum sp. ST 5-10]|uniref:capsule biosynthesis GfcC family protein n=1 Tax=unclassified Azospirillum TaxID=2630922 RepID=UPI003F4A00BD